MSDAEDDYLSDKFLAQAPAPPSSKPSTYAERRRHAQREAEIKNVENRRKSRRELEEESRREGLSKSLFEKAQEEEQMGTGQGNKAMAMMMKMGFKPGQSLGKIEEPTIKAETQADATSNNAESMTSTKSSGHLVEPLPLDVWSGRQGVGKRKRAVSPTVAGKLAKVVQQVDEEARGSFRERARQEYEERRSEGRLVNATRTCVTLDEKAGKTFNVLWLNPQDPETFPPELLESLTSETGATEDVGTTDNERLRQQMRADALQPLSELENDDSHTLPSGKSQVEPKYKFPSDVVDDARVFICLNAQSRLDRLLSYLREEYFYCFWCGTQYTDLEDMSSCPGPDEEAHD